MRKGERKGINKYINGKKGVISILLAALLVPSILLTDALVETSRYHAVVSTVDRIMDSAATSTLANYDDYLLNRFGLPAITQNEDFGQIFEYYYKSNSTSGLNAWDQKGISVEGKYALSDLTVLEHEITEFSKYTVPADIAASTVMSSLEDLLGELDGLKAFKTNMDTATDTVDAISAVVDAAEALEKLQSTAEDVENKKNAYEGRFNDFKNSIGTLAAAIADVESKEQEKANALSALNSAKAEAETVSDQVKEQQKRRTEIFNDYTDGKIDEDNYKQQTEAVDKEIQNLQKALSEKNDAVSAAQSEYNTAVNNLNAAKSKVSGEKRSATEAKREYGIAIGDMEESLRSVSEKTEGVIEKLGTCVEKINKATTSITANAEKMKTYKYTSENEKLDEANKAYSGKDNIIDQRARRSNSAKKGWNTRRKNEAQERAAEITETGTEFESGTKGITETISDAIKSYNREKLTQSINGLSQLKLKVSQFNIDGVTSSTSISESDYFLAVSGYVPSRTIVDALKKVNDAVDNDEDAWSVIRGLRTALSNLLKIKMVADLALNADVALGDGENVSGIQKCLDDLDNALGNRGKKAIGFRKLKAIIKLGKAIVAVCESIIKEAQEVITGLKQLKNSPGDKFLLTEYLNQTCANRCSYEKKNSLTGFSFGKAGLAPTFSGSNQTFCGAEVEYLIHGSSSEYKNQANLFFRIYLLRLILDVLPIIHNTDVRTIARGVGAIGFGLLSALIPLIYCIIEPFIDTMVIVNDGKIDFWKTCVYLTPSGFSTLLSDLSALELTDKEKAAITDDLKSSLRDSVKDKTGHRVNFKKAPEGYSKDSDSLFYMDYSICTFIFMFVKDKNVLLKRFRNIISMESRMHYGDFNIDKTYTYLTASSTGQYVPFISAAEIYSFFAFSKKRTLTRGY